MSRFCVKVTYWQRFLTNSSVHGCLVQLPVFFGVTMTSHAVMSFGKNYNNGQLGKSAIEGETSRAQATAIRRLCPWKTSKGC